MILRRIRHLAEYGAVLALVTAVSLLPRPLLAGLAGLLGRAAFSVFKIRRKTVMRNLRTAFPEKGDRELRRIAIASYRNIALIFTEFARFPRMKKSLKSMVSLDPPGRMEELLGKGKGIILVSAHFGNWEILAAGLSVHGFRVTALARNQKNTLVDGLIHYLRTSMGTTILRTNLDLRVAMQTLRSGGVLYLLSDQNAGRKGTVVDFFGRPTSTPQGAAQFRLKTGAPMAVAMPVRGPGNTFTIHVEEVPGVPLSGDKDADIAAITQAYTAILEKYIRAHPEQWLWVHRRWLDGKGRLKKAPLPAAKGRETVNVPQSS